MASAKLVLLHHPTRRGSQIPLRSGLVNLPCG
jgi:hypothetical protein